MPDKISDNDIKKALEDLKKCNNNEIDCGNCTLSEFYPRCPEEIGELALDLINRLEAKIDDMYDTLNYRADKILELEDNLKTAKAEAYKECIEKVKAEIESWTYHLGIYTDKRTAFERLDNLLKELVGE